MKYIRELLTRIINGDTAQEILAPLDEQNRGHVGEALLRVLTLLGIHPTDPSSTVIPCTACPVTRRIEPITNRIDLINTGLINSGGANKIDVCWLDGETVAVCSSKIGKNTIKSVADLEIGAMLTEFTEVGGYTMNGKRVSREVVYPYVLAQNKPSLLKVADKSKASNRVSKDNLNPLDVADLNRMCAVLLGRIAPLGSKDFESLVAYLVAEKRSALRLRFHQHMITLKVRRLIAAGQKTILIGALPRSGKTWMGAFLSTSFKRVLIITTRPGETRGQWLRVFKIHREFSEYTVMNLDGDANIQTLRSADRAVAVVSSQFLKYEERPEIAGLDWDLVLLDEVHEGGSTDLTSAMLDAYIGPRPIRIMMTATYTKPQDHFAIPDENCCFWDLEDVRLMRKWGDISVLVRLSEKYGTDLVEEAQHQTYKSGETDAMIRECYVNAPQLGILTTAMQSEVYDVLNSDPDSVYGFSMRSLLMPTRDGTAFQNQRAVDTFLALISGSDKMRHYKSGDMSMYARIQRYWATVGHRGGDQFMTQIWFLPSGVGQLLDHVKSNMLARIAANPVLRDFATMTLDSGMVDISKRVADAVVDAKGAGKRGLILLTGDVGSLGISLPEVDVAFMMHDIESADKNYQQLMRVLTEMQGKRCGLVVDFNVWRLLTTLDNYATSRGNQSKSASAERINWCLSHLVDVDPDLWTCPESPEAFTKSKIVDELTVQWRKRLEYCGSSLQKLSRSTIDLGEDQQELDKIAKYMGGGAASVSIEVNPDQEKLDSGIEHRSEGDDDTTTVESDDEPAKQANLNEVLARLIPEMAILSGCKTNLLDAIKSILDNPQQHEAMNDYLRMLYA